LQRIKESPWKKWGSDEQNGIKKISFGKKREDMTQTLEVSSGARVLGFGHENTGRILLGTEEKDRGAA